MGTAASDFAAFLAARSRAKSAPEPLAAVPQALKEKRDEHKKEQVVRAKEKEKRERVRRKRKKLKRCRSFEPDPSLDGESLNTSDECDECLDELRAEEQMDAVRKRIVKRLVQSGLQLPVNGGPPPLLS